MGFKLFYGVFPRGFFTYPQMWFKPFYGGFPRGFFTYPRMGFKPFYGGFPRSFSTYPRRVFKLFYGVFPRGFFMYLRLGFKLFMGFFRGVSIIFAYADDRDIRESEHQEDQISLHPSMTRVAKLDSKGALSSVCSIIAERLKTIPESASRTIHLTLTFRACVSSYFYVLVPVHLLQLKSFHYT
ncbi:hypothetical protein CDAR_18661 [Caerostris darwini]|uniref:Uncharacterized protein n=1 Tax=Caerostris darwini TaxID=1538125 RepID=A0AAV4RHY5_9ARAC|nr:hypothetical protein CDAR_18661 [Caerostris darwini]